MIYWRKILNFLWSIEIRELLKKAKSLSVENKNTKIYLWLFKNKRFCESRKKMFILKLKMCNEKIQK